MENHVITLSKKKHKETERILIKFKYSTKIKEIVKHELGALWSNSLKCWYLIYTKENLSKILNKFEGNYPIINNIKRRFFSTTERAFLNGYYKYLRGKRYSDSTVNVYTMFIADLVSYYKNKNPKDYTHRDVELYIENSFIKKNYSISSQRQFISAVKQLILYYPHSKINTLKLTRPKVSRKLPSVLSQNEILNILAVTKNLKHRTAIAFLYSCGLRISELLSLKLENINIDRKQVHIKMSKGRKDRYVGLADSIIPLLRNYIVTYSPEFYFIEGIAGEKYSADSIRKVLKRSSKLAGIKKNVTPHTLRHSYATHMLENGVGIRYIQTLLGHSRPETTMIYTHVKKTDLLSISNPLDLALKKKLNPNNKT